MEFKKITMKSRFGAGEPIVDFGWPQRTEDGTQCTPSIISPFDASTWQMPLVKYIRYPPRESQGSRVSQVSIEERGTALGVADEPYGQRLAAPGHSAWICFLGDFLRIVPW